MNDKKKVLIEELLTKEGFYDKIYQLKVNQSDLDKINNEICPLYLEGKWFHNMVRKKYHKEYKSKRDAF